VIAAPGRVRSRSRRNFAEIGLIVVARALQSTTAMETTTLTTRSVERPLPLSTTPAEGERGIIGFAILWWLGVPFTVLLLAWLLFFR
jgi:hypothetical protein